MKHLIFTFVLSFFSFALFAQISGSSSPKDIMAKKSSRVSKAKLSTRITFGGNYQTGNIEKASVSGTAYIASIDSIKEFSANNAGNTPKLSVLLMTFSPFTVKIQNTPVLP